MTWRKPSAGDASPFGSASVVRRVMNGTEAIEAARKLGVPKGSPEAREASFAELANQSGSAKDFGDALELTGSYFDAPQRLNPWFNGDDRGGDGANGVLIEPVNSSSHLAHAQVDGIVLARVDIGHVNHTHCFLPVSGSTLKSGFAGNHKIVWKPTATTGVAECWVLLNSPQVVRRAKADEAIVPGDTAKDVKIWINGADVGAAVADYDWGDDGARSYAESDELWVAWLSEDTKLHVLPSGYGATPFKVRNEYSNLSAGRGLELGQIHSPGVVKANLRDDNTRAYCVLTADLNVNTIGPACVDGWVKARVDVTQVNHTHCYLPRGETIFKSNFGGPMELLQTPTETGEQDLFVRWQPLYKRWGVTLAEINEPGAYASCNVLAQKGGVAMSIGTVNGYLVRFATISTIIPYATAVGLFWSDDEEIWIIDSAACE